MKRRRVSISEVVALRLRELHQEAVKTGRGELFKDAVRQLIEALHSQPLPPSPGAFGCPEYHLPHMRLLACIAVTAPVSVRFAVPDVVIEGNSAEASPVFVMRFDLLS